MVGMPEGAGAETERPLPLAGVRVIDLTRVMTGPYGTMMLGDLGADVIKVEIPGRGDDTRAWGPPFLADESVYFLSVNRNKRSVALDLKSEGGKEALWRLIEGADVLMENFSPGTLARLGFGYEAVAARNPSIIFASISGWGQTGPDYNRTAYDLIVQGMSGMMSITGHPGGQPTRLGVPIADIGAGMFAAFAVAAALYERERTGQGRYIDTSMLGGQVAVLTYQAGAHFATGETPGLMGNAHPMIAPYDTFPVADGHVNIAVGNDGLWARFCTAIERPELISDPRFVTNSARISNRPALYEELDKSLRQLTGAEVVRRLDAVGVPCGLIRNVAEVLADPQVQAQDLVQTMTHPTAGEIKLTGAPYHFQGSTIGGRIPPPRLGEHTLEVLQEAGFTEEEAAALIASGAAATIPE
jgi:formyl-CoA transferase